MPTPPFAGQGLAAALFFAAAIALAGMPPLSGFLGKLLILDALRDRMMLVWPVVLVTSLIIIVGFSRAGSLLFWKSHASPSEAEPAAAQPLALTAIFALLAGLVALTVFAGPVTAYMQATAIELQDGAAYITANRLSELP